MSQDIDRRAEEAASGSDDEQLGVIYGEASGSESEQSEDEGQQVEGHPQAAINGHPIQGIPVAVAPVLVGPVAVGDEDEIPVHEDPVVAPINDGPVVEEEAGQQPEGHPQAAEGGACNCQPCCDCVDTFYTCGTEDKQSGFTRATANGLFSIAACVGTLGWQNASNPAWATVPRVLGISLGAGVGASCVGPMAFWGGYAAYRGGKALKDKCCPPAEGMAAQGNGGAYQALNEEQPGLQQAGPVGQVMR